MTELSIRARIEASFIGWGRFIVRHRWLAIVAIATSTLTLATALPRLTVDNSSEAFLHGHDSERLRYDRFRELFDRDDRILVIAHPPEIFDLAFLERLKALHDDIVESVPYLEEVTSLVNARNTRGEGDRLIVEDLLESWPRNDAELAVVRARVLANPLYRNILISENARYTTITLKPFTYSTLGDSGVDAALAGFDDAAPDATAPAAYLTEAEDYAIVTALREVLDRHRALDLELYVVGGPTMDYALSQTMQRDVTAFMGLSIAIICGLLLLLFRRIAGVLLPLVVVVASMVSSMGVMVLLGIPFSMTLNMLPAFLMVVGVCDSVHLLVIVYQRLAAGASREDAIALALGHSGLAVVMTSVTTAAGLLSFVFAELAPIAQLGVIAPIGVMLAMVYTLVLLPALLACIPERMLRAQQKPAQHAGITRFLVAVGDFATLRPWQVVGATAAVLLVGVPGLLAVRFSHNGMRWFPADDPIRIAADLVDREFKGVSSLEVLVHTGHENGLHDPELLGRLERAMRTSETMDVDGHRVNKAVSIVDVVKETNQALNANDAVYYTVPAERRLVAQELLLFENSGSDDLTQLTDSQLETARMTIRMPWVDAMVFPPFIDEMRQMLHAAFGTHADFELTGGAILFTTIFKGVISSMVRSYAFALLVITPLMVLLIGNLRQGLAAMIPNLIPVYLVLCLMGYSDIPIDVSTLLIGGIIIGIAVDDTIHFMHKFNRYYQQSGDARLAVHETLTTTGTALLFTSLVLGLGFAVFLAAYLTNIRWFGLLASTATVVAFAADVVVGPALMVLVTRSRGTGAQPVLSRA